MSATTLVFIEYSKGEYSKGARKKKRRDITLEDSEKSERDKPEVKPEPEVEIGRETISREGFFPTEVRTPARRDPTRDFKMRIEFTAERAEFFPVFIPGNAYRPVLSGNHERTLTLEDGEEGVLCVLENEDGALQFTIFDLWGPVHITSFPAKSIEEILGHFSGSRRFAGPVGNFFWKESQEKKRLEKAEQKRAEEEQRRLEEERKRLEHQERKKGLLGRLKSLIRGGA